MSGQGLITGLIVAIAAGFLMKRFYATYGAPMLANILLKSGKVRLAMKVRGNKKAGCGGDCACD